MRLRGVTLVVLALSCLLVPPLGVFANAGPARYEWGAGGVMGNLVPTENDAVAVRSEHLRIDFAKARRLGSPARWLVPVDVSYRLLNASASEQTVLLAFPYWVGSDSQTADEPAFAVALDGQPVPNERAAMDDLRADMAPGRGEGMLRDLGEQARRLRAISFTVALPPGAERTLEVAYDQWVAWAGYNYEFTDLVQLDYILLTARQWKDFANLTLEVRVPQGAQTVANLLLSRQESQGVDVYTFISPNLPQENLRVATHLGVPFGEAVWRQLGQASEERRGYFLPMFICGGSLMLVLAAFVTYAFLKARQISKAGAQGPRRHNGGG